MSVRNRIKVITCKDFEEAETKVNDFLANDPDVEQLIGLQFMPEFNRVLIEYIKCPDCSNNCENRDNNGEIVLEYSYATNPYLVNWLDWFRFLSPSAHLSNQRF